MGPNRTRSAGYPRATDATGGSGWLGARRLRPHAVRARSGAAAGRYCSERNILVRNGPGPGICVLGLRRALIEVVAPTGRCPARAAAKFSAAGTFTASAEQD